MPTRARQHRPARVIGAKQHTIDDRRPSSSRRGYNWHWRKVRQSYLEAHPICSHPKCEQPATDVDHVDRNPTGPNRYDFDNLQGFCHSHHSSKTAREDGGFGNKKRPRG